MKKLLTIITTIIILTGCKKDIILPQPLPPVQTKIDSTISQNPTQQKVGFIIDTNWFNTNYKGYTIQSHNWYGHGDFNNDGLDDIVVLFASNATQYYFYQKDLNSRTVVGVFLNHKTYFELDTNLVYSYLGGWHGVNVSDINSDGYLDIHQMTGYWETPAPKPSYYNNNGWGGMDSYVFINNKNKGFTKYTIPVNDCAGSSTTIINGNKIYTSACMVNYEFTGNGFTTNNMVLNKTFNGVSYDLRVITPKFKKGSDVYYIASNNFSDEYFILKTNGNTLSPIVKYKVPYNQSGFTDGTNGERNEMYIIDLDKDGKDEYIIPSQIFNTDTSPNTPYLMIVDSYGNDVTTKFLDAGLEKPLAFNQFNAGIQNVTGFIYHTIKDIDGDGIPEIFPASGLGYRKDNDTYYYKFINGKYTLKFYHSGWFGDVNTNSNRRQYRVFVDEKNGVNAFMVIENSLYDSFIKTF